MSQWNLSVRLTGQGTGLARTLRSLSRDAQTASRDVNALTRDITRLRAAASRNIRLSVRIDARNLRRDVQRAVSTAGAGQGIGIRLGVDARRLRRDVQTALTAAGAGQGIRVRLSVDAGRLRQDVQTALSAAGSGQGLGVSLRLTDTMQLRRDVADAVRWAAQGHRIQIPIGLADPMQLRRDVSAAVRWASMNQTITVRVTPDTSALTNLNLPNLVGGGGGGRAGASGMLQGLLLIAPAVIPLVAGLSTGLGTLASQFAVGGTAAAAFGIALAGQVERLGEVADAEKKYQDAVREHGQSSAEATEAQRAYQQQLATLPPEAQKAAVALSGMKTNFRDWSDDMAGFTMEPVTKGITILDQLIPRLTPHVQSSSKQLTRLMDVAGGAVNTPGFDAMADRFADFSDRQLDEMTDGVIHFLRVLSEGGQITSGPLAEFMAYARENGPAAREALSAISAAVVTLARGAAEAGPTMLTLVTAAARLVAALPPELVGIILQVATALKLLQLSGAGMAALAAGVGRVRTQIATLGTTAATAGGGLAGLRAAFLALGTAAKASIIIAGIAALAYAVSELSSIGETAAPDVDKLTTSLGKLGQTGKVTGEAARAFGKDFGTLKDQIGKVINPSVAESINNWGADISNGLLDAGDATEEFNKSVGSIDEALTNLVRGGKADLARSALTEMMKGLSPEEAKKFRGELKEYDQALSDLEFEQRMAAQAMGLFGQAAQDTQAKLDAQKQSADGLRQSIVALNEVNRAAGSAMSAFEQSIDDATEAVKEHQGALKLRDGELDLGSEKAREAEKVLSDLAANTDAAATAAREQGKSWEAVSDIQERGRKAFIDAADAMGLTKTQAEALADSYLGIPDKKTFGIEMRTEDAVAGLDQVIAAIEETPDAKSVTVKALTADAQSMLRGLGFEVTKLKDGSFRVTASTATAEASLEKVQNLRDGLADKSIAVDARTQDAINSLQGVQDKVAATKGKTVTVNAPTAAARHQLELLGFKIRNTKGKQVTISVPTGSQRANVASLAAAIASLRNKTVTITTNYVITGNQGRRSGSHGAQLRNAQGGVWDYYADGGVRPGRVTRFAAGGMADDRPNQHVAQIAPAGSWRVWAEPETQGEGYVPFAPSKRPRSRAITEEIVRRLGGDPTAIQWNADGGVTNWRYDPSTGSLYSPSDAGAAGRKTRKVKGKEVEYFDLGAVESKLRSAARATQAWNKDLEKVADRVGGDVAEALASMGEEGMKLADKMANGSTKYINEMAAALRNLQATAKASLTDYTRQLTSANKVNKTFADNLAKLASQGYGDLAAQLAAQGDEAAQQLAAAAVKDKSKAGKANAAASAANRALTSDEVASLVQIIAAIVKPTTGIHDVAAVTGLGEDVIIAIANKAKGQITSSLGSRAGRFMGDLKKANAHQAYADGGIRAGLYATRGGIIRFAEPETHGEAYVPLAPSKRRSALPVLNDVAHRFGLGLTDARATRPVVIVRESSPTTVQVTAVRTGASASDIGAQVGRQIRRARRGGVAARAA